MTAIRIKKVVNKNGVEYWFNVTDILQSMIGNCIEKAEVLVVEDLLDEVEDSEEIASRTAKSILKEYERTGALQFNCMTLRIAFKEGETIYFKNNEFGLISKG